MMFDLGVEISDFVGLSESRLREMVQEIDNRMDLVMIAERMDESLVLLRHLLNCDWSDVVSGRGPIWVEIIYLSIIVLSFFCTFG